MYLAIGVTGFEPTTSASQKQRSTKAELHPEEVGSSSPLLQNLPREVPQQRGGGGW